MAKASFDAASSSATWSPKRSMTSFRCCAPPNVRPRSSADRSRLQAACTIRWATFRLIDRDNLFSSAGKSPIVAGLRHDVALSGGPAGGDIQDDKTDADGGALRG